MKNRELLIVIDAQNDYAREPSLSVISNLVENAVKDKCDLIYTMNTFDENESDICVLDTKGCDIARKALPKDITYPRQIVWKRQPGYYWGNLRLAGYEKITVVGYNTDTNVITNVLDLGTLYPSIPVCVYENACAGTSTIAHAAALLVMENCGVTIENFKGVN